MKNPHSLGKGVHFDKLIPLIIDKPNQWRKCANLLYKWWNERREHRLRRFNDTHLPIEVKKYLALIMGLTYDADKEVRRVLGIGEFFYGGG